MFNLVWKEQSTKRWIITTADSYDKICYGQGENRPEWFSTRREALLFIKDKFQPTYVYRKVQGLNILNRFDWSNNCKYLGAN